MTPSISDKRLTISIEIPGKDRDTATRTAESVIPLFEALKEHFLLQNFLPDGNEISWDFGEGSHVIQEMFLRFERNGINVMAIHRAHYLAQLKQSKNSPFSKRTSESFRKSQKAKDNMGRQLKIGGVVTTILTVMPITTIAPGIATWMKTGAFNEWSVKTLVALCAPLSNFLNWKLTGSMPDSQIRAVDAAQHHLPDVEEAYNHIAAVLLHLNKYYPALALKIAHNINIALIKKNMRSYFSQENEIFINRCCRSLSEVKKIILYQNFSPSAPAAIKLLLYSLRKEELIDQDDKKRLTIHHDTPSLSGAPLYGSPYLAPIGLYDHLAQNHGNVHFLPDKNLSVSGISLEILDDFRKKGINTQALMQLIYLSILSETSSQKSPFSYESSRAFENVIRAKTKANRWLNWGGSISTISTLIPFISLLPSIWDWSQKEVENNNIMSVAIAILNGIGNILNLYATGFASDKQIEAVDISQYHYLDIRQEYKEMAFALIQMHDLCPALAHFIANKIKIDVVAKNMERFSLKMDLPTHRDFCRSAFQSLDSSIRFIQGLPLGSTPALVTIALDTFWPQTASLSLDGDRLSLLQTHVKRGSFLPTVNLFISQHRDIQRFLDDLIVHRIDLIKFSQLVHLTKIDHVSPFYKETDLVCKKVWKTKELATNALSGKGLWLTSILTILSCINLIPGKNDQQTKDFAMTSLVALTTNAFFNLLCTGFIPQKRVAAVDSSQHQFTEITNHFVDLSVLLIRLSTVNQDLAQKIASELHVRKIMDKMALSFPQKERFSINPFIERSGRNLSAAKQFVLSKGKFPFKKQVALEIMVAANSANNRSALI